MTAKRTPMQRAAVLRLLRVASDFDDQRAGRHVKFWDDYTSGCDARAAINLAHGVHPDLIDGRGLAPLGSHLW